MYKVEYTKLKEKTEHVAVFDNLEDAILWWESVVYLRKLYLPLGPRPK